jgi:hypothetical protein
MRPAALRTPPRAPWGSFPLSELCVLLALGLGGAALATWGHPSAVWLAVAATAVGCLAGLELALREHLTGFRGHAALLAGAVAVVASSVAALLPLTPVLLAVVTVVAFGGGWWLLRRDFRRRADRPR